MIYRNLKHAGLGPRTYAGLSLNATVSEKGAQRAYRMNLEQELHLSSQCLQNGGVGEGIGTKIFYPPAFPPVARKIPAKNSDGFRHLSGVGACPAGRTQIGLTSCQCQRSHHARLRLHLHHQNYRGTCVACLHIDRSVALCKTPYPTQESGEKKYPTLPLPKRKTTCATRAGRVTVCFKLESSFEQSGEQITGCVYRHAIAAPFPRHK